MLARVFVLLEEKRVSIDQVFSFHLIGKIDLSESVLGELISIDPLL
jgi:hypothetical protein